MEMQLKPCICGRKTFLSKNFEYILTKALGTIHNSESYKDVANLVWDLVTEGAKGKYKPKRTM